MTQEATVVQPVPIDSTVPWDVGDPWDAVYPPNDGYDLTDDDLTDDELTALALAADPEQPLDDGAVPLSLYTTAQGAPLPLWYMPPAMSRATIRGWRTPVVVAIIAAFLLIDALGLCITYGQLVVA
jgi:hypothetical protein